MAGESRQAQGTVQDLRYLVLINRGAGTVRSIGADAVVALVSEGLEPHGAVDVRLAEGGEIGPLVDVALAQQSADVIVVGGGDGTVASVAAKLLGRDVALAVLPLGTMNMVSKAAGFTQSLPAAIAEIAAGEVRAVDAGQVNGRVFLHQVSFGIQPRVVRIREKIGYRSRLTKILSGIAAMTAVLSRPRAVRMVGEVGGKLMPFKVPALMISNNPYRADKPRLPERLDGGLLGIYLVKARRWPDYGRLVIRALRGTWKDDAMVEVMEAADIRLRARRKGSDAKVLASVDGELVYLASPIEIASLPQALKLVMPREPAPPS